MRDAFILLMIASYLQTFFVINLGLQKKSACSPDCLLGKNCHLYTYKGGNKTNLQL